MNRNGLEIRQFACFLTRTGYHGACHQSRIPATRSLENALTGIDGFRYLRPQAHEYVRNGAAFHHTAVASGYFFSRRSRMCKNVLGFPALQVEFGPRRQKLETGLRQRGAPLAREHRIQPLAQTMQMQYVGGRVSQLRLR